MSPPTAGTFVTPYDVLTAAHCVFDVASGVSFTGWTFEPGKVGRSREHGAARTGAGAGMGRVRVVAGRVPWCVGAGMPRCVRMHQ